MTMSCSDSPRVVLRLVLNKRRRGTPLPFHSSFPFHSHPSPSIDGWLIFFSRQLAYLWRWDGSLYVRVLFFLVRYPALLSSILSLFPVRERPCQVDFGCSSKKYKLMS